MKSPEVTVLEPDVTDEQVDRVDALLDLDPNRHTITHDELPGFANTDCCPCCKCDCGRCS